MLLVFYIGYVLGIDRLEALEGYRAVKKTCFRKTPRDLPTVFGILFWASWPPWGAWGALQLYIFVLFECMLKRACTIGLSNVVFQG